MLSNNSNYYNKRKMAWEGNIGNIAIFSKNNHLKRVPSVICHNKIRWV
jgi:hypothetical protein